MKVNFEIYTYVRYKVERPKKRLEAYRKGSKK